MQARITIPFLILILSAVFSYSQVLITTTASDVTTCPGGITVPVVVTDFYDVAAISLVLSYDTMILNFDSYQNLHDSLSDGFAVINATGGKVYISWISLDPATIGNDTLIELNFVLTGDYSNLIWDTITPGNCQYGNFFGNIIPSYFINGNVNSLLTKPELLSPPNGNTGVETNPTLMWNTCNCSPTYRLQFSTDSTFSNTIIDQSGITENLFEVTGLNYITKYYWRINAKKSQQITPWSETWNFTTAFNPSEIFEEQSTIKKELIKVCPNPVFKTCKIEYYVPSEGEVSISLLNSSGNFITTIVNQQQDKGDYCVQFDCSVYSPATYFLSFKVRSSTNFYSTSKMILKLK